ncbi:unnamed protein product [Rotaria sp. Silwood1]|nr:unnamed protein product [Rotaria sp. Silwood1]CAF4852145.1 unnamed protein product [Rotaria sp. Silwood1]
MGLAAAAANNTSNSSITDFYALNRTLPPPPPPPPPPSLPSSTGTLPFNIINQSSNNNLQFVSNPTGHFDSGAFKKIKHETLLLNNHSYNPHYHQISSYSSNNPNNLSPTHSSNSS